MAAAKLLDILEKQYRYISDSEERINFILASYNAGFGHILDAMRLAHKHGKNKHVWQENVDSFLIYKSLPEFYTDSLCRNGEFKDWKQTLSFVRKVNRNWKRFSKRQKAYRDSIDAVMENDTLKRLMQ
jgi:membrane-bound lytic murein transglycosylase F